VAWTIGRERMHESCIDLSRSAGLEGTKHGSWKSPTVRLVLQRAGGQLCASCLAMTLRLSLDEVREVMHSIDGVAGLRILPMTCGSCARAIDGLCIVPVSDEAAAPAIATA
jgi:hypothetical protein